MTNSTEDDLRPPTILVPSDCYHPATIEPISDPTTQHAISTLYWATSFASVLGNLIVLIVQIYGRESFKTSIRLYLANLAVADICTALFSMPFTYSNVVLGHWTHPHWLCPTAQYAQLLGVFVTSTTLTIIGIERYIATLHPLSSTCSWFKSHTRPLLVSFWLLGAAYAYIPVTSTSTVDIELNGTLYWLCTVDGEKHGGAVSLQVFIVANLLLTYLLPLTIMTASYTAIMRKLSSSGTSRGSFVAHFITPKKQRCTWIYVKDQRAEGRIVPEMRRTNQSRPLPVDGRARQTIRMLFMVLLLYLLCWSPVKLFQFLRYYRIITFCSQLQYHLTLYSYIACHWFAMANSCINPVIYSFFSRGFRNDCQKLCYSFRRCLLVDSD